jgi:hypothetical protein
MPPVPSFIDSLRDFAAGMTPLDVFNKWLVELLVQGPSLREDDEGKIQAHFPIEGDAAMYLDMVADPKDPNFDEQEARRLAGSLCAVVTQVSDPEDQAALAHLARWARRSAEGIREYLAGTWDRAAFERFLSRRPWPDTLQQAVKKFDSDQLEQLARGLEINDFVAVANAFEREEEIS